MAYIVPLERGAGGEQRRRRRAGVRIAPRLAQRRAARLRPLPQQLPRRVAQRLVRWRTSGRLGCQHTKRYAVRAARPRPVRGRRTHSAWGLSCPVPLVRTAPRLRGGRVSRGGCGSGPDPVALSEVRVLGGARRERGCGCRRVVVWVVEAVKVHGRDAPRLSGMDAAKLCQESARSSTNRKRCSPAEYLRNSPRRRRNRRRRLSSRRPATELLSGLGMSAPPSTPPSTSPEGATASGTIAGVFVTLVAAAVLAYSMVVQRHARRSRPRPVWPGCRRGPPG